MTDNYLGFHSNVFGYVTRVCSSLRRRKLYPMLPIILQIQIPLLSVTSITKEKTAKIIPNAVAVSTEDETHTFTSLISRDATFKAMTKAWRKAIARSNLSTAVSYNNIINILHVKKEK